MTDQLPTDPPSKAQPNRASYVIHVISHVRWSRESVIPFQAARLRMISVIDSLIEGMAADARFRAVLLDGQVILLEDYLALRPERFEQIERLVQDGSLSIGPWYVLPSFVLCSAESIIRNLMIGLQTAHVFGASLPVAYMPEGSGLIAQMPQILRGFQLDAAAVTHGLSDDPAELVWEAPDGSRVVLAYLREGIDPLRPLSIHPFDAVTAIRHVREKLAPYSASGHLAILHRADAINNVRPISQLIDSMAAANIALPDTLFHSTLAAYIDAIRPLARDLPVVRGDLRAMDRHPLGQGTLSTRMWIKQHNHAAETLLTQWVEPFTAWAESVSELSDIPPHHLARPQSAIGRAWRYLLENQAQNSLNGTVSDAVCADIHARFDQVAQIGEALIGGALHTLADQIDTSAVPGDGAALIVFNPNPVACTDQVDTWIALPGQFDAELRLIDAQGIPVPFTSDSPESLPDVARLTLDRDGLQSALAAIQNGRLLGHALAAIYTQRTAETLVVIITISADNEPATHAVSDLLGVLDMIRTDESLQSIELHFRRARTFHLRFVAANVPPLGYAAYGLALPANTPIAVREMFPAADVTIENATLRATLDTSGLTVTLLDKVRGLTYRGLLELRCEGERGDAWNYSPVGRAIQVNQRLGSSDLLQTRDPFADRLHYRIVLLIDATPDMEPPTAEHIPLEVDVTLTLLRDVPRLDVQITLNNALANHRLRAHFRTPFAAETAQVDRPFEVVTRPIQDLPPISPSEGEAETPLGTIPQSAFTGVFAPQPQRDLLSGDEGYALARPGLVIANRGLPEVEVTHDDQGNAEIAVTLLRSVSWLRRNDILTRAVHDEIPIPMPGLTMFGMQHAELSIIPTDSAGQSADEARAFSVGAMRAVITGHHPGSLPTSAALVSVSHSAFVISAVKLPHDSENSARSGLIVRGCNLSNEPTAVTLTPWRAFTYADVVHLDESETGGKLAVESNGTITFKASPHRVLTFWLHD